MKKIFVVVSGKTELKVKGKKEKTRSLMLTIEGGSEVFSMTSAQVSAADFAEVNVGDRFELVKVRS